MIHPVLPRRTWRFFIADFRLLPDVTHPSSRNSSRKPQILRWLFPSLARNRGCESTENLLPGLFRKTPQRTRRGGDGNQDWMRFLMFLARDSATPGIRNELDSFARGAGQPAEEHIYQAQSNGAQECVAEAIDPECRLQ